jgi:SnoaL-like domain
MGMELTADDRLAIQELCARVCHTLDFDDPDGYAALFRPDGVFQRQASQAAGGAILFRRQGHDQLKAFAKQVTSMRKGLARHWTGNIVITPAPGGAHADSYTMLIVNDPAQQQVGIALAGRYRDELAKTADGWRFAERTVVDDL